MKTATSAAPTPVIPCSTTSREARRWIERQLVWERTSGIGRNFSFTSADPDRSNGKLNYDLVSLGLTYRFR